MTKTIYESILRKMVMNPLDIIQSLNYDCGR